MKRHLPLALVAGLAVTGPAAAFDLTSMSDAERERIEADINDLQQELRKVLHRIPQWQKRSEEEIERLNRQMAAANAEAKRELAEAKLEWERSRLTETRSRLITPIGGGGLMSGTAISTRHLLPDARIIGAEPAAVDDAFRSLQSGKIQPRVANPETVADGLLTALGDLTFRTLRWAGVEIVLVEEPEIVAAALFHIHRMKLVVEPSGATGLAVVRKLGDAVAGRRVGIIISGGNTDFSWMR